MIAIYSDRTDITYKAKQISYNITSDGVGQVFIDNAILVSYEDCKNIKEVEDLFKEDYKIRRLKK